MNAISHELYIGEDGLDDIYKTIYVPFPLAVGMELMAGVSSDWNHFRGSTVEWNSNHNEMVCWLEFVGLREGLDMLQVRTWLLADGWSRGISGGNRRHGQ